MASKVYLEKAYDRVIWDFLEETLVKFNFPKKVKLILSCVSGAKMKVLWNGEMTDVFSAQRGLRQGDPLSSYLFVLYLKRLGRLIEKVVSEKVWKPIVLRKGGIGIFHLFFVDDLFFFCKYYS